MRNLRSIIECVLTLLLQARNLHTGELAAVKIIKLEPGKFYVLFCIFALHFQFSHVYFFIAAKLQTKEVFFLLFQWLDDRKLCRMCYYSWLCPAHYFLVRSYLPYHCFIKKLQLQCVVSTKKRFRTDGRL